MEDEEIVVTKAMRRAVHREQCRRDGHDLRALVSLNGKPTAVTCERCEDTWKIER